MEKTFEKDKKKYKHTVISAGIIIKGQQHINQLYSNKNYF